MSQSLEGAFEKFMRIAISRKPQSLRSGFTKEHDGVLPQCTPFCVMCELFYRCWGCAGLSKAFESPCMKLLSQAQWKPFVSHLVGQRMHEVVPRVGYAVNLEDEVSSLEVAKRSADLALGRGGQVAQAIEGEDRSEHGGSPQQDFEIRSEPVDALQPTTA